MRSDPFSMSDDQSIARQLPSDRPKTDLTKKAIASKADPIVCLGMIKIW